MHTYESSLRLLPLLICLAALLVAACGDGEFRDPSTLCESNSSAEEETMATTPEITDEYIHQVRLKYDDLFWRQPNVEAVSEGFLRDENGESAEPQVVGIIVRVTKKVDQSEIPVEDRNTGLPGRRPCADLRRSG